MGTLQLLKNSASADVLETAKSLEEIKSNNNNNNKVQLYNFGFADQEKKRYDEYYTIKDL